MRKFLQKLFKIVSYFIFSKIHGKIKEIISTKDDERIKVKIINIENALKYKVYKISSGRLYTDRIHDIAVLIDNKVIDEPSLQQRYYPNSHVMFNSKIEDNIVFSKGTPRKLKILDGLTLSLLTGGGANSNYWHWLFDVLPRLYLCSKMVKIQDIDYFLLPDTLKRFQIETLNYLNISKNKRLSSEVYRHIKARELIVTDHPVVVTGNSTVDNNNQPAWIAKWLRDTFINKKLVTDFKEKKKFYIDRSDKSEQNPLRTIDNEDEVKHVLKQKNFTHVKLHEISFKEQVNLFYNAECVVGLHGAGFANLVFSKEGTKVIELRSFTSGDSIKNISRKNNFVYNPIVVESKQTHNTNHPMQQGSHKIPIDDLITKIES
jgi:capsular polysaccharide biosynthesis protein